MNMRVNCRTLLSIVFFLSIVSSGFATELPEAEKLFKQKCALCHAIDKKTPGGPAVNTMSNEKEYLRHVITKGEKSMPAYEGKLTAAQIDALANYLLANKTNRSE